MMEILSYGGGIQTVALAILNVAGTVEPRASHAVFADPGSEMPGTYEHIDIMKRWLAKRGMEFVTVRNEKDGPLEQYVRERSTVIPVQWNGGMGRRQCTSKWKVEPIERWLRAQHAETAVIQLGISLDEFHRMKANQKPQYTNRHPLIDLRLTRRDCRRIIEEAGLPVPPKSACFFCPFHRNSTWQNLAVFEPELFEHAAELEDAINQRKDYNGQHQVYLSNKRRPLRTAFSPHQYPLPLDVPEPDDLCGGHCMV